MALTSFEQLNFIHLDVIKELGSIGSSHAASALSNVINQSIRIGAPEIRLLDYEEVTQELGGPEDTAVGILISLGGDIQGMIMFILGKKFAHITLSSLLGSEINSFNDIDEMGYSAITEIGNIMAYSYVNAIASMTNLRISLSVPSITVDMVGAMITIPAIHYSNISDKIMYIKDKFITANKELDSHILLIPDVDSIEKLMTSLGIEI